MKYKVIITSPRDAIQAIFNTDANTNENDRHCQTTEKNPVFVVSPKHLKILDNFI